MGLVTGPGPVFVYETITAARRFTPYLMRSAYVAALLVGLYTVWESHFSSVSAFNDWRTLQKLARLGQDFFEYFSIIQISLVLLAGPRSRPAAFASTGRAARSATCW